MPVVTVPSCPHCGAKLIYDDDPSGELYCTNGCLDDFPSMPDNIDTKEYAEGERLDWYKFTGEWYKLPWEIRETICWYCFMTTGMKVRIPRNNDNDTGTYGHSCYTCGKNLEENPRWGKGGPRDLALHRGKRRHE